MGGRPCLWKRRGAGTSGRVPGYPLEDGDRVVEVETNAGGGIELQLWGEGVPMCVCGKGGTPNGSRCTCVGQVI